MVYGIGSINRLLLVNVLGIDDRVLVFYFVGIGRGGGGRNEEFLIEYNSRFEF